MRGWIWMIIITFLVAIGLRMRGRFFPFILGSRSIRRVAITIALRIPFLRNQLLSSFSPF
ncbi:hypothetical protein [Bacillus piscicola]|uniref:hypothetical protein n=1 Tax=Bacillus piscicola TaxID=1632684 RepID=UPI001F0901EE|nr:hypothetical protein [Bacillus piscicola]